MTSHECHGISNHQLLDCLFNRFSKLTTKTGSELHITGPLQGEPTCNLWFLSQKGLGMQKVFLCHDILEIIQLYSEICFIWDLLPESLLYDPSTWLRVTDGKNLILFTMMNIPSDIGFSVPHHKAGRSITAIATTEGFIMQQWGSGGG